MELLVIILGIAVWFGLKSHINKLEARVAKLEGEVPADKVVSPIPQAGSAPVPNPNIPADYKPMYSHHENVSPEDMSVQKIIDWVKKDFMVKLGAFLLIIALGWFVNYAIESNWIGPLGQISFGILAGIVFLGLGVWRIPKFVHQGGIFSVLGATIVLLTMFAAREVYDMFTPYTALGVMFLTVAFLAFVSVRYKSEELIYVGLIMANIAPFLTNNSSPSVLGLLSYLLIVTVGALWVVWITGWTRIIFVSLATVYLHSLSLLAAVSSAQKDTVLMFSFVFVSIYFLTNLVSLVRRHGEGVKHMTAHILTALGTIVFLLTWIESALAQEWKSLIYVAWALIFAVGTYAIYAYTANKHAFYIYGATSIALIGIATAAELDGPVLTLAFLFEICLLVFAAAKLKASTRTLSLLSWLFTIPVLLSLESLAPYYWRDGIFHEHFIVVSLVTAVLAIVGLFIKESTQKLEGNSSKLSTLLLVTSGLYAVSLVWLTTHALVASYDLATTLSLVIYTIAGVAMVVSGTTNESKALRICGSILVGGVIARLLLIEVADMNLEGRIVTFVIIGVLLISTAFINKLHKKDEDKILP